MGLDKNYLGLGWIKTIYDWVGLKIIHDWIRLKTNKDWGWINVSVTGLD